VGDVKMGDLKEEIDKTNAKFIGYLRKGDSAGMATLYTEDACLMPTNSPPIVGKENIKGFWGAAIQTMGVYDAALTTVELIGKGDTVSTRGDYKLMAKPEGQEAGEDVGKYVVLWKKTSEGWKLHWDIFNTNLPAP
jgi:uncharacterized protein (TIGR02246 family)